MAALETTLDARPDVVVGLVREYADRRRWWLVSAHDDGADLVFKRFSRIWQYGQKVYVTIEAEDSEHTIVAVESEGLTAWGTRSPSNWLDFGQGKRLVLGLLDFLTETTETQV
jgi:hypothetical protein